MLDLELKDDTLILLRNDISSELKIYHFKKDNDFIQIESGEIKPFEIYPLSYEKTTISLSTLAKGEYLFRLVDYKNKTSKYIRILKE